MLSILDSSQTENQSVINRDDKEPKIPGPYTRLSKNQGTQSSPWALDLFYTNYIDSAIK